jgi:hypothetical protein
MKFHTISLHPVTMYVTIITCILFFKILFENYLNLVLYDVLYKKKYFY